METWTPIATIALGYVAQWLRAFQRIPNPFIFAGIFIAAVALYLMGCNCQPRWDRDFFISSLSWVFMLYTSIRGTASTASDTKAAPKTDTI